VIKIFPEIILKASNNNKPVGAFRFWCLAKDYDCGGSGYIPAKDFRNHLIKELNIPRSTVYRWIDQALDLGLTERKGEVYRLAAWDVGAKIAGVTELMPPVHMPLKVFVKKGWTAGVWAAFLLHFKGKGPKSRAFFESRTGVPFRTQWEYEKQAGVKKQANYANLGDPSKDPQHAAAIDGQRGIYGYQGQTRRRLPNSIIGIPEGYTLANKGNTGKRNRKLRELQIEGSIPEFTGRQYCQNDKEVKQAIRQDKDQDAKNRTGFIYRYVAKVLKVGVYDAVVL